MANWWIYEHDLGSGYSVKEVADTADNLRRFVLYFEGRQVGGFHDGTNGWHISGEKETLTVTPSIQTFAPPNSKLKPHHGYIRDGKWV